MNLYEITKQQLDFITALTESEGELSPEMEEALKINKDELQAKGLNYGFIVKNLSYEAEIIDLELKRLATLKKARLNAIERLKTSLCSSMQVFNVTEIKSPTIKINFRTSEAVEVLDVNFLPDDFKRVKVEADKVAIKEALKNGVTVQGAKLITNTSLQIR